MSSIQEKQVQHLPEEVHSPSSKHSKIDNVEHVKAMAKFEDDHHVCILLDVRGAEERAKDGHIPHSKNLPLDQLETAMQLDEKEFEAKYGFKKPNKETPLVCSCWAGMRGKKAQEALTSAGFTHVKFYEGSYKEWYEKVQKPAAEGAAVSKQ